MTFPHGHRINGQEMDNQSGGCCWCCSLVKHTHSDIRWCHPCSQSASSRTDKCISGLGTPFGSSLPRTVRWSSTFRWWPPLEVEEKDTKDCNLLVNVWTHNARNLSEQLSGHSHFSCLVLSSTILQWFNCNAACLTFAAFIHVIGDRELRNALAGLLLRIADGVTEAAIICRLAFIAEFQIPTLCRVWRERTKFNLVLPRKMEMKWGEYLKWNEMKQVHFGTGKTT